MNLAGMTKEYKEKIINSSVAVLPRQKAIKVLENFITDAIYNKDPETKEICEALLKDLRKDQK